MLKNLAIFLSAGVLGMQLKARLTKKPAEKQDAQDDDQCNNYDLDQTHGGNPRWFKGQEEGNLLSRLSVFYEPRV